MLIPMIIIITLTIVSSASTAMSLVLRTEIANGRGVKTGQRALLLTLGLRLGAFAPRRNRLTTDPHRLRCWHLEPLRITCTSSRAGSEARPLAAIARRVRFGEPICFNRGDEGGREWAHLEEAALILTDTAES